MQTKNRTLRSKEILISNNIDNIYYDIKVIGFVYVEDYNELGRVKGNRNIDPKNIANIKESYKEHGVFSCPIVCKQDNKYMVIDGQTRVEVSTQLGLPILCLLVEVPDVNKVMIAANANHRNWRPEDYLNHGIEYHKNKDYSYLKSVHDKTGISIIALYEIYSYGNSLKINKELFELGEWKITNKQLGDNIVEYVEEFSIELGPFMKFAKNANFIRGFLICASKSAYDQEHMLNQLKKYKTSIHDGDKPRQHANMLNIIYNKNCEENVQVYIA